VVNDRLDAEPHASEPRCPGHDIRVKEQQIRALFTCSSPRRHAPPKRPALPRRPALPAPRACRSTDCRASAS